MADLVAFTGHQSLLTTGDKMFTGAGTPTSWPARTSPHRSDGAVRVPAIAPGRLDTDYLYG
jgi:hypothetical protein